MNADARSQAARGLSGRLGLAPFGIRQCMLGLQSIFGLGIKPAVACLHQFAEVVLRNGDGRIFLCLAWSHATLEAANDRVRIWLLIEDNGDALLRHAPSLCHPHPTHGQYPPALPPPLHSTPT